MDKGNLDLTRPLPGSTIWNVNFLHICLPPSKTSPTRASNTFSPCLDKLGAFCGAERSSSAVQRSGESCFTERDAVEFWQAFPLSTYSQSHLHTEVSASPKTFIRVGVVGSSLKVRESPSMYGISIWVGGWCCDARILKRVSPI
jgi:hypothetical protein